MLKWNDYFGDSLDREEEDEDYGWQGTHDYSFKRRLYEDDDEDHTTAEIIESIKKKDFLTALKKIKSTADERDAKKAAKEKTHEIKPLDDYNKTGIWRGYGYYVPPRLDTRYIDQVANALAARYNIDVRVGDSWHIDLKDKVLTYDPSTLVDGTKGRMLAALLHEIGHLRHSTIGTELKSQFITKYGGRAHHVVNLFEDLRIDTIMAESYGSAKEIFEENKPIVRDLALGYAERAGYIKSSLEGDLRTNMLVTFGLDAYISTSFDGTKEIYISEALGSSMYSWSTDETKAIKALRQSTFGSTRITPEMTARVKTMYEGLINMDTLEDYSAAILLKGYDETVPPLPAKMQARLDQTEAAINPVKKETSTQNVVDKLDQYVFPVIEDLLKAEEQLEEILRDVFGNLAKDLSEQLIDHADKRAGHSTNYQPKAVAKADELGTRAECSNRGEDIPAEWIRGEYEPLLKSVKPEIDRLVRKLNLLKKEEEIPKHTTNHKRGKLHSKVLHRVATGGDRLFKKTEMGNVQTDAHCFSVVIDTSGSMYDDGRQMITHAVRGAIMFGEVFDALGIPYEVVGFDTRAKTFKKFEQPFKKDEKKLIAGIPARHGGGSTNLDQAFKQTEILKQPKKNKTMVILSDGGIGNFDYYRNDKAAYDAAGVKLIGISINAGPRIVEFCGNGKEVRKVAQLPEIFSKIIREAFKGGKRKNF